MNIEEARKHLKKNLNNWKKSKKDNGYMPEIMEEINTDYEAIETLLTAYEKEKEKNKKIEKELEKHIKFCEQEAEGSLNNEICHIALKFNKGLLDIINEEE